MGLFYRRKGFMFLSFLLLFLFVMIVGCIDEKKKLDAVSERWIRQPDDGVKWRVKIYMERPDCLDYLLRRFRDVELVKIVDNNTALVKLTRKDARIMVKLKCVRYIEFASDVRLIK